MRALILAQTPIGNPAAWKGIEIPVAITMVAGIVLIILGLAFLKVTGDRERKFFELITEVLKAQTLIANSLHGIEQALQQNNSRLELLEDSVSDLERGLYKNVFRNDGGKPENNGGKPKTHG